MNDECSMIGYQRSLRNFVAVVGDGHVTTPRKRSGRLLLILQAKFSGYFAIININMNSQLASVERVQSVDQSFIELPATLLYTQVPFPQVKPPAFHQNGTITRSHH